MKISWIGAWVSRIDWCKGDWCGLTHMVVRLSDIRSKPGKKRFFCVFRLFLSLCRTASRPYRLSHIIVLRINQFYKPKDQSMKFSWKYMENWWSWKMSFFWVGHFEFFCFILMKTSSPFIWGIIYFYNMDGSFRILEKTSSELICTRLYLSTYWRERT